MPLFLVNDKNGLAIVQADDELDAKLRVMDSCLCDVESLAVAEIPDFGSLPNGVFEVTPSSSRTRKGTTHAHAV